MTLTTKYKQQLKAQAHSLKPVVLIGQHGLTDAVKNEIDQALLAHELIKVRMRTEDRDEKRQAFADICAALSAELVQLVGGIGVIYRKNVEEKKAIQRPPRKPVSKKRPSFQKARQ